MDGGEADGIDFGITLEEGGSEVINFDIEVSSFLVFYERLLP